METKQNHIRPEKKTWRKVPYRLQSIARPSKIFRNALAKETKPNEGGVLGVLLEDDTIAWSSEVPRHIYLEEAEGKQAVARVQTHASNWHPKQEIQVHALNPQAALKITRYIVESGVPPTAPISLTLVDNFLIYNQAETFYQGLLGEMEEKRVLEKMEEELETTTL